MIRSMKYITTGLFAALLLLPGCAVTVAQAVYKTITYDDVVYVRETGMMYKRFRRDGLMAPESLRKLNLGSITRHNEKVIIFDNFGQAVASGLRFYIDPESRPDVPYTTHSRSTTIREQGEYRYNTQQKLKLAEDLKKQGDQAGSATTDPDAKPADTSTGTQTPVSSTPENGEEKQNNTSETPKDTPSSGEKKEETAKPKK